MARPRRYHVSLTAKERKCIQHLKRKASSQNMKARFDTILEADENHHGEHRTYADIAHKTGVSVNTVMLCY